MLRHAFLLCSILIVCVGWTHGLGVIRPVESLALYGGVCNGVADDTAAFLAFKAAHQNSSPIQLNLPGTNCTFTAVSGPGQFLFMGIGNLVVAGNGSANSRITNSLGATGNFLFGGAGEYQDNLHSLRTNTANIGDSCITIKTVPSFTVSNVTNNSPATAVFTASVANAASFTGTGSGTNLTTSSVTGTIKAGAVINGSGIPQGAKIVSQTSGPAGGAGVYVTSAATTASAASLTASDNVINVTAIASGTIAVGASVINSDSNSTSFARIAAYGSGGTTGGGGLGTYQLTSFQPFALPSGQWTSVPASFTADINTSGVLNVTAVSNGALAVGQFIYASNSSYGFPGTILSQISGAAGGVGTYQLSYSPTSAVSSQFMQANGQIRLTVSSTAGMSTGASGDNIYITGVSGLGVLPQRVNGLRWVKVINGTQVDLIQSDFNGLYLSGGSGGGDRTSLTPVGSKVMMSGWVNQAYWAGAYGFPSNQHWFEYKTVASTNSTTHQVCFDTPLANAYKSTWPQYNTGSQFEIDAAGPATLYLLDPSWELVHEYRDFTLNNAGWQTTANGRSITWRNVQMLGALCAIPTQNETHNWINVNASTCNIETDKLVKTWNITNSTINLINVQSSSMDRINVSGVTANRWYGSPKELIIDNSSFTCTGCTGNDAALSPGTLAYGASDETSCTNCVIGNSISYSTPITQADNSAHSLWTMAGGVITIPNTLSISGIYEMQTRGLVPGHYVMWTTDIVGRAFKVLDVTQDLVNTYVTTSEAGGFPIGTWQTAGVLNTRPHPAPKFTCANCTSAPIAISFNGCAAQLPMFSCQNFTYTGSASGLTTPGYFPALWGKLDTFTFTNNVPYGGVGNLTWQLSQSNNWNVLKTDNSLVALGAETVNARLPSACSPASACTRTLTTLGATNTQVGDTFSTPPTDAWFGGTSNSGPVFSANTPSDSPQVTISLKTNQSLPYLLRRDVDRSLPANDNRPLGVDMAA